MTLVSPLGVHPYSLLEATVVAPRNRVSPGTSVPGKTLVASLGGQDKYQKASSAAKAKSSLGSPKPLLRSVCATSLDLPRAGSDISGICWFLTH